MVDEGESSTGAPQISQTSEIRQVKLPPFWQTNPTLWFVQVEAQFYTFGIRSDNVKYFTVIGTLDSSVLQQISDIVEAPPEKDKYDGIKKALIARFSDSQDKQLRKLLNELELGDKRPSQLLREMKALAGTKIDESVLKSLWMQRLPSRIQIVLSASKQDKLEDVAEMADKIVEISLPGTVAAVSQSTPAEPPGEKSTHAALASIIASLQQQVITLSDKVEKFSLGRNNYGRSRSRSRSRSSRDTAECYFHRRFGSAARNCRAPCNFKSTNQAAGNDSNRR